jgi:integrase/recombinase XerD
VLAESLRKVFRELTTGLGLRAAAVRPRVHDLRHRFAVQTLIDWQRSDENIDERMTTVSTYLGHYAGDRVKRAERDRFREAAF